VLRRACHQLTNLLVAVRRPLQTPARFNHCLLVPTNDEEKEKKEDCGDSINILRILLLAMLEDFII